GIEKNPDPTDTNPFRYCGEYYDAETQNIYLRNRYYNPANGRFMTEDPHWNVGNMIYGNKKYVEDEVKIPDVNAILQSSNLYVYCRNNPVKYVDPSGETGTEVASVLLWDAFVGGGVNKDYTYYRDFYTTFFSSSILNKEINKNFETFKSSGKDSSAIPGSIAFYGNDTNPNDLDLHLGVGKADYTMVFEKKTVTKRFLWITWTETQYSVTVTISDTYDFDEYREGVSISNWLNNWGYDMQKKGQLTPFFWTYQFTKGL
ncbi:MAG: RHS repeat-associated core domain-containing protein, partial [Clostridia bacterium]|nr:RHS repeat-associated core domain-containing protein [Clostridia bacterium]